MKRILLSVLVIGILFLSACGPPTTAPEAEAPPLPAVDINDLVVCGMSLDDVAGLYDQLPRDAQDYHYQYYCMDASLVEENSSVEYQFEPSNSDYFVWLFSSNQRGIPSCAVCFHEGDPSIVVSVDSLSASEEVDILNAYPGMLEFGIRVLFKR